MSDTYAYTSLNPSYQVIQLRWYGGVYSGGDAYADVFESTSGVPLEITSAVFAPDGTGNAIPSAPPTLIALGTVASLDWEQAILASVVLDADADYVHPSFIMLPIGNIADLPFAVLIAGAVTVSIDNTDVNVADPTGLVTFVFSEAPTSFALADTSAVGGTLSNLSQVNATTYTATFTGAANTDIANALVSVTTAASIQFSSAVATFTGVDVNWAPSQMIDGMLTGPDAPVGTYRGINGWSVFNTATGKSEGADALLTIASPLPAGKYELTFKIYQNYYGNPGHLLGDFALEYTTAASPTLSSPQTPVSIESAASLNGTTFSLLSTGELLANSSHNSIGTDTYTISALVDSATPITGIFLDAIKNPALPADGPGLFGNGNFVVSEFTLDASIGGSTAPFTVDTVAPTVGVSIDNTFINQAHTTGTVTFTFSEAPTAFTLADTSAVGGTLSNLTGGGETYTATFTGAAKTQISNASVGVTAGSWQEDNGNPGGGGSTALFKVDTLTTPEPPTIAVSNDLTVHGQVIALSTLVAISDPFRLGFQKLELWDSNGTVAGGQFLVNGTPQTGGHEIDVSPANVVNTVFDVGTLGGTDTLWARLLQDDGTLTSWQQFTVTAPIDRPPVVAVENTTAAHGQSFAASSLFTASDPDSDAITEYDFWDSGAGGGHFVSNGQALGAQQDNYVSASQLTQTTYQSGSGADTLWVRVSDGALWSAWSQSFTVTAPVDTPPVIVASDLNVAHGQAVTSPYLFAAIAGGAVTQYQVWDSATDPSSGYFVLDGQVQNERQSIDVNATDLNNLFFQSGSGSDLLWVRASDGLLWSPWKSFTVTAPVDTGPKLVVWGSGGIHNYVRDPSNLVSFQDNDGDSVTKYQFWEDTAGPVSGYFTVNGIVQPAQTIVEYSFGSTNVSYHTGNGGATGAVDHIWVRAFDGIVWGSWYSFDWYSSPDQPPVVTTSGAIASHGQSVPASSLFSASDPDTGETITKYQFWDSTADPASGHFLIKGQIQPAGQALDVNVADLANTSFQSGSGSDLLWVRASDGVLWGSWASFTVTAPIDTGPTVTAVSNINTTAGQTFAASNLFTANDPFNDPIEQYDFWDTGSGGGRFMVNGQALGTNQDNYISTGQLAQASYVSGSSTDTLWVRVSEGGQWSPWSQSFTVSDPTTISEGQTLELASAYSGQISFEAPTGILKLLDPGSFAGTVAGMTGQDTIDFADIDPTKVQTPNYSGDTSGGTLTVTDGTHSANIALLGNYLASTFVASSDGHGGTNVVDPPATGQVALLAQHA